MNDHKKKYFGIKNHISSSIKIWLQMRQLSIRDQIIK